MRDQQYYYRQQFYSEVFLLFFRSECRGVNNDDVLNNLRDILLDFTSILKWVKENWYWVLVSLVVVGKWSSNIEPLFFHSNGLCVAYFHISKGSELLSYIQGCESKFQLLIVTLLKLKRARELVQGVAITMTS